MVQRAQLPNVFKDIRFKGGLVFRFLLLLKFNGHLFRMESGLIVIEMGDFLQMKTICSDWESRYFGKSRWVTVRKKRCSDHVV